MLKDRLRAHPRSRGENASRLAPLIVALGSSPLTRGKPDSPAAPPSGGGLIPAHAGKTACVTDVTRARWAHPRSRGENLPGRTGDDPGAGSSPLTRGKHVEVGHGSEGHGLIPAHAGKTPHRGNHIDIDRAHPRSRGENDRCDCCVDLIKGSSPLTRGKPPARQGERGGWGLIPAHAGKTWPGLTAPANPWAHPRSRGENTS